jgi:hypothetical protein
VTRVRLVAVGLRLEPARVASLGTFAASLRPVVDGVVPAADEVATLIAFPEHTGLLAMLTGAPGAEARAALGAGAGTVDALTALAVAYGDQLGHYATRFPQVRSAGTLLHLALTDTLVHVLVETFGGLARTRRQWVSVGTALADWAPVAGPPAAGLVRLDPDREYAYAATSPAVRNRNLVFGPDGRLVTVQDKAYLVPVERDADAGLGLAALPLDRIEVAQLPIGRLGSVISKDAWMVDVNERLDQLGAQVLVQPEAFDRWGEVDRGRTADGLHVADLWPPDKFQRGGWWMVQRHPSFRVNVTPMLLGTLGDLHFDGQPLVAVPPPAGGHGLGLLGQPPDAGWAAVGPWWRDPRPPAELADERRRRTAGRATSSPRAASPTDPGDVLAWTEIDVPRSGVAVPAPPRLPEADPSEEVLGTGSLLVPDLTVDGDEVVLAAVAGDGSGRQEVVVTRRGHEGWGPAVVVAPPEAGIAAPFDRQWRPRVIATPGGLACVFLAFPVEDWDLFAVVGDGDRWAPPVRVDDAHSDAGVLRERGHDAPVVVHDGDDLVAVWSDLRWPWVLPQIRAARSADGGRTWSPSVRIDGGPLEGRPDPLAPRDAGETRGQTAPSAIRTPAGLVVAWQERVGDGGPTTWIIHDGGEGWTSPHRLADAGSPSRWRPALAASGHTVWLVDEVASRDGGRHLEVRVSEDGGRRWGPAVPVDPSRPTSATQRRAVVVASGPTAVVVFEDDRDGQARILAAPLGADGPTGGPWRLDDAPAGAHARAPTAVGSRDTLVVAWQDTRADGERVRSFAQPLSSTRPGDPRRRPA